MKRAGGLTFRWAFIGMATGLVLALGEVGLSLFAGESPFWGLWAAAAFAYVSILGLAGGGLGLIASGPRGPATLLGFAGAAGVAVCSFPLTQEFMPARSPRALLALGGLVLGGLVALRAHARRQRTEAGVPPGRVVFPLLALGVALTSSLASWSAFRARLVPSSLPSLAGAFAPPFLLMGLAYGAVHASTLAGRRSMTAAFACAALVSLSGFAVPKHSPLRELPRLTGPQPDRPNIVLIVLDDLRAQSLSSYGNPRQTSPALDRLATGAVRYANCIAPSTWTLPSHAALFTGLLFPLTTPHSQEHPELPAGAETLAEVLADHGYLTAGFAANHVVLGGRYRLEQGFQYFESKAASGYRRLSQATLRDRLGDRTLSGLVEALTEGLSPFFHAEEMSARARAWISRMQPSGRPYFLFLNYLDVHGALRHRWGRGLTTLRAPTRAALLESRRPPTEEERLLLVAAYDRALEYLDRYVGDLLRFLADQPDAENTWIIVTSDHGDALGEHGRVGHNPDDLHQEILHVPLIVKYPRARLDEVGVVNQRLVELVDVFPTVLERLGLTGQRVLEGRSLQGRERDAAFAEGVGVEAVLAGHLKYVEQAGVTPRLFDLQSDPQELRDLAPERTAEAKELRDRLSAWRASRRRVVPRAVGPPDGELLRTLGYVK